MYLFTVHSKYILVAIFSTPVWESPASSPKLHAHRGLVSRRSMEDGRKALDVPVHLCSDPHLCSWVIGNDCNNKFLDTSSQNVVFFFFFYLHNGRSQPSEIGAQSKAIAQSHPEQPIKMTWLLVRLTYGNLPGECLTGRRSRGWHAGRG